MTVNPDYGRLWKSIRPCRDCGAMPAWHKVVDKSGHICVEIACTDDQCGNKVRRLTLSHAVRDWNQIFGKGYDGRG